MLTWTVVTWIVVAVVVCAVLVLAVAVLALLGRLAGLQRAAMRLQQRQVEATTLQQGAEALQVSIAGLQQRAERAQDQVTVIKAARGERDRRPGSLLR